MFDVQQVVHWSKRGLKLAAVAFAAHHGHSATTHGIRHDTGFGESYTLTQTKKDEEMADQFPGGTAKRHVRLVMNPKPVKNVYGGIMHHNMSFQGQLVSNAGTQNPTTILNLGHKNQWLISSTIGGLNQPTTPNATALRWFDLNPNQKITGSSLYPGTISPQPPSPLTPRNDRLCWQSSVIHMDMTNFTAVPAHLKIYFLRGKKACTNFPELVWTQGLISESMALPTEDPPSAGSAVPLSIGYPNALIPHFTPTSNEDFRSFYKVMKCEHVDLAAESSVSVRIDLLANVLAKQEVLDQLALNGFYRDTFSVLVVPLGALVEDTTISQSDGFNGIVTHGSTRVGYVCNVRNNFRYVAGNGARLNTSVGYTVEPVNAVLTNQRLQTLATNTVPTAAPIPPIT